MKGIGKKLLSLGIVLTCFLSLCFPALADIQAQEPQGHEETGGSLDDEALGEQTLAQLKSYTYDKYLSEHEGASLPKTEVSLKYDQHKEYDADLKLKENELPYAEFTDEFHNLTQKAVISDDETVIGWTFTVPESGFYSIKIVYYNFLEYVDQSTGVTYKSRSSSISRRVYLDGKIPYYEARQFTLTRCWENQNEVVRDEVTNNDIRPFQQEMSIWQTQPVKDHMGYYTSALKFYVTAGEEHTIMFEPVREACAISEVIIYNDEQTLSYEELKAQYNASGYKPVSATDNTPVDAKAPNISKDENYIYIEAEDPTLKSEPTMYGISDRSSPLTYPYHHSKIRLNTIGGDKWQNPGEWMEWSFSVKNAGLYRISFKARQNLVADGFTSRQILLDGKELCGETNGVHFNYSSGWKMVTLGSGQEEYLFYLSEGEHTLRMVATLGDISDIFKEAEDIIYQFNIVYRDILMLTGSSPDVNRDYQFEKIIPGTLENLKVQTKRLEDVSAAVKQIYGSKAGQQTSVIESLLFVANAINKDAETIKDRFGLLKDNIAAMGTWINDMREQPLALDYIIISAPDSQLPRAEANFFESLVHEVSSFIASFTEDYDNVGSGHIEGSEEPVTVWIETGAGQAGNRDNATILKQIIDEKFTPDTGIPIQLKLVAGGALTPAILAGNGPDACLSRGSSDPVNFALRGATVNLNDPEQFENCEEVFTWFSDSALRPLRFRSGIYGLPETQDFLILYYRTDICEELGINPKTDLTTWEGVKSILPILQGRSMNFGMPVSVVGAAGATLNIFATLLYQMGGELYEPDPDHEYDGVKTTLDQDIALDAFKLWTDLYTVYGIPNAYDFANWFRSGEMPIGIAGYSAYNLLSVFAPELEGFWSFGPVPGIKDPETGVIDNTAASTVMACVMMSTAKNKVNAWKFLSWWTGEEAQALFGREIESMLGSAARYQTANLAAFDRLPWDKEQAEMIKEQWQHVKGIPEVPGSYYTGRNIEFAWREVISTMGDSNMVLIEFARDIDDEITRKREEFANKLEVLK